MDCLHTNNMPLIDFATEITTSEIQITSYLQTTDRKRAQVAIQNSLQERTEIEVSGGKK